MEQKKFDKFSFIGMILIGLIMLWYVNNNKPKIKPEEKNTTEQVSTESEETQKTTESNASNIFTSDSLTQSQNKLGLHSINNVNKNIETVIENEFVKLTISNKGGQITEALVKKYKTYDSLPLYLIKNKNASFNIDFGTTDSRILNTKNLFFEPTLTKNGEIQTLSMKLKVSEKKFLEYIYEIKPNDYRIGFTIKTQGLNNIINSSQPIHLNWKVKALRNEKSMSTENMYSKLYFKQEGNVDYLSPKDKETINEVDWVAFKQHFFSSVLLTDTQFNNASLESIDALGEEKDSIFGKTYNLKVPLTLKNGELTYNMQWFYGPTNYNLLKTYEKTDLKKITDLGWGIFGFLNRTVFYPVFNVLKGLINSYGLIIILMTIVVKILLSPVLYKSYSSSAKMKIIRPEIEDINKKYPGQKNAMKRQQEIMDVQRKAGVNVMSGCIPALLQMPVFFALFKFFPTNFDLRQKSFLWANDLSSYDSVIKLPFKIPFYGDHISLFPILASVAIFFYMQMNQSQQMNMQTPQEGMPDMSKMMKYMIYFSPIMMLIFFNNYASGLSLYYFISNILTIIIMLVIKNFVIDEKKIHAQIEENKKKPIKKSKFRERLDAAMKEAQAQQEAQRKTTNKRKK